MPSQSNYIKCKIYKATYYGVRFYSLGNVNINRLECVQRSAARMHYKDFSSVSTMLNNLNLVTHSAEQK